MSDTPNYVLRAVEAYMEGDSRFLVNQFENGVPLYSYPESREIIVNLLRGQSNRRQGRPPLTRRKKDFYHRLLMRVAELHGAGLGLISKGNATRKPTACGVVSEDLRRDAEIYGLDPKKYGLSAEYIYEKIWKPNKDSAEVQFQLKLGSEHRESILKYIEGT